MDKSIFLQFLILRLDRQIRANQLSIPMLVGEINNGIHRPRPRICDGYFFVSRLLNTMHFYYQIAEIYNMCELLLQSYLGVVWRKMFLEYEMSASQSRPRLVCTMLV
jgi:hypothetical protein